VSLDLGLDGVAQFILDSVDNRVFCLPYEYEFIPAICGEGDTVVGQIELEGYSDFPFPACYSPRQNCLFVVSEELSEVTVVDAATCRVIGRVPLWQEPYWLCSCPQHDKIYCLDHESSLIGVIDCAANHVLHNVMAPATDLSMPVYSSGSDRLFCVGDQGSDDVLVSVDCATDSVVAMLQMNYEPAALAYNPTGDKVYWADYSGYPPVVSVVDCRTNSIVASVVLPDSHRLLGITCNPDSNRLYAASARSGTLWISAIDGAGDTVTSTVPTGLSLSASSVQLCYVPSADVVFSTTGKSSIIAVDGAARQVLGPLPVGDVATELLFNPLTNRLYCLVPGSSSLVVFDCRYMSREATVHLAASPSHMGFDSIANRVYTTHLSYDCVTVVDGSTNRLAGLFDAGNGPYAIVWSPQHRRMYVADRYGPSVAVLRDTAVTGVGEGQVLHAAGLRSQGSVVRGVLWQPKKADASPGLSTGDLLDVGGRRALVLHAGANDLSRLAPGVYFVREELGTGGDRLGKTRKVVIAR